MNKKKELKQMLEKLPQSEYQGVLGSNSDVIYPFNGVYQGELLKKAYALSAGKIICAGTFKKCQEFIQERIE